MERAIDRTDRSWTNGTGRCIYCMSVGEVSSEISHDGRLYTRAQQKTPKYFPSNGHSRAHFALHSSRFQGTSMVGPRLGGVQHSQSIQFRPCTSTCVLAAATVHVSKDAKRKRALNVEHCRDHLHLPRQTLKSGSLRIADSCARRGSDENALAF